MRPWLGLVSGCLALALAASAAEVPAQVDATPQVDVDDLLGETQKPVRGKQYTGIVWWIPPEFWEASSDPGDANAKEIVAAMSEYTTVAVVVGKLGAVGTINWVPGAELRSKTVLRDANGVEYSPVENISQTAQVLSAILKPILGNAIGKMGENLELMFFPAKDKAGKPIAAAKSQGMFSVVLRDITGPGENISEWRLPLNSLLPPKFCPLKGERVNANWLYCPWHGVPLSGKEE